MSQTSSQRFKDNVHAALRSWHKTDGTERDLLTELLVVQAEYRHMARNGKAVVPRLATNNVLNKSIAELETQNPEEAHILRLRFQDGSKIQRVANTLNLSNDQVNRRQSSGITQLTSILWAMEEDLRMKRGRSIENQLPPATYTRLFGMNDAKAALVKRILQPEGPCVIAVSGLGGIGKTSLADAVTREVIQEFYFEDIIWLRVDPEKINGKVTTAQQVLDVLSFDLLRKFIPDFQEPLLREQREQRLRQLLNDKRYLVVIDNIETPADLSILMLHLVDWASPSKFLITTRTRPSGQSEVYSYPLMELSEGDSADLLRYHASTIGLHHLSTASAEQISRIYQLTGGNPLALKLVVSLATTMPLPHILADLEKSRADGIFAMYQRIYWQAWHSLSQESMDLLQSMPLVGEQGADPKYLQVISGLDDNQIWPAIDQLATRSLIEVRGTPWERQYGVHRLTKTFLKNDILNWPKDDDL